MDEEFVKSVARSSYRVKILKSLGEKPKMPSQLAADCNILQNHISNVLSYLGELGLVVCINPEIRKGRIYRLSEDGEEILKYLE
ncbi:ArsR family transcriptional regulator [Methanobrevibacter sp.]|uniref:ArsR family transcriptional regulator n=1 Tax=Methanobrevibacter sp. TaxID=66852 RepID=UPI00388E3C3F